MGLRHSAFLAWSLVVVGCGRGPTTSDEANASASDAAGRTDEVDGSPGTSGESPDGSSITGGNNAGAGNDGSTNGTLDDAGADASSSAGDANVDVPDAQMPPAPFEPWPEGGGPPESVRLNHVQMVGTHNSYHVAPLIAFDDSHRYTHKPLDQQLTGGVRAFELDLHGGNDGKIHVYHIQTIDDRTTCSTLKDCLQTLKKWSDARPTHTPIFVWLEIKNDTSLTPAIEDLTEVEKEILAVIPEQRVVTPDFIRKSYPSPRARVEAEGWPALRDVSGMFVFMVIDRDDIAKRYSNNHTTLNGRMIWINAAADQFTQPWALMTKVGGPSDVTQIAEALKHQLIIATNTCAINNTDDACQAKLENGLNNGVHMLKDDLPFAISGRSYFAKLPAGSPGCHSVTAEAECDPTLFE